MKSAGLLARGVDEGAFPLARLEVFHDGGHVISAGNASPSCLFDIASVTKVMSTTALVLDLRLSVDEPVQRWLPEATIDATLADLLFHRSGLPAFIPFFSQPGVNPRDGAIATPRAHERKAVYSDLGFIQLGAVLEAASGLALDTLFAQRIAAPLGLTSGYRRLSACLPLPAEFAATGSTRPREPAPGQEGMWNMACVPTGLAEVDDDNAWAMDGVSGHAGLFSTARDVARFGQAMLDGRWRTSWRADASTPGSTRAFGFDTPSAEGASCGPRSGKKGPRGAIGHLGFTGTSLWIDLDRRLVVAFLTNRVALGRANIRIREYRPLVHDAVLDDLGLE
ncbi:MAG: serine hydrolase domain-containing protein [Archangium sp.]